MEQPQINLVWTIADLGVCLKVVLIHAQLELYTSKPFLKYQLILFT